MKRIHNLLNQKTAQRSARFMQYICYIIIALFALMLMLSFMGRLQYNLRFGSENYPRAIYSEENHNFTSRSLTVKSNDDLRIITQAKDGKIELGSYIALVLIYAINLLPIMLAYWFLAKVFANVSRGEIFTEKNADYLLYYGVIQAIVAVIIPFVKLLVVQITNMLVTDIISLSTGSNMLNQLIPSIAFLVAAYIIKYGVHLQDEADHTL